MKAPAVLALLAFAAAPALAQVPAGEAVKRFAAYTADAAYHAYVAERLNEFEPAALKAQCGALKAARHARRMILNDPEFKGAAAAPSAGLWIDRVAVDRCGKPAYRNIMLGIKDAKLQSYGLLPGQTGADPRLQRDALVPAAAAARIKSGCQDAMPVVDTMIDGKAAPGAPWKEDWTFLGCGKTVVVGIAFTPDGKGGTGFSARAK